MMTKLAQQTLTMAALIMLLAGCQEQDPQHPAMGKWKGSMVSNGVIIDIGTVKVGADFVHLTDSKVYRSALNAQINDNAIYYSDPADSQFNAKVRLINNNMASMQMQGIGGYIDLKRDN